MSKPDPSSANDPSHPIGLMGKVLVAMPSLRDPNFHRSLIYLCAHSDEGAMGLVINRPHPDLSLDELILQLNHADNKAIAENIQKKVSADLDVPSTSVLQGGPVEAGRGFVLHSGDKVFEDSLPVGGDIYLTASVDILFSLQRHTGPELSLLALGYAGWGAGQLEKEMEENAWIAVDVDKALLFAAEPDNKYDLVLETMGVKLAHLVADAGHA